MSKEIHNRIELTASILRATPVKDGAEFVGLQLRLSCPDPRATQKSRHMQIDAFLPEGLLPEQLIPHPQTKHPFVGNAITLIGQLTCTGDASLTIVITEVPRVFDRRKEWR